MEFTTYLPKKLAKIRAQSGVFNAFQASDFKTPTYSKIVKWA
jgi:hypothetical protein